MADVRARSPLQDRAADLAAIGAGLVPFLVQVDLRVDPSHAELAPLPLPLDPNTAWHDPHHSVMWLGPDEWLVLSSGEPASELVHRLQTAFTGVHHSAVDVSANRVAVALTGDDRFELLSHLCSLDLDARSWGPDRCAQTLLGRAQVILFERTGTTPILARPSFADYVVDLLLAAHGGGSGVRR
jgi:sarcosine oxidase, subunit gamma